MTWYRHTFSLMWISQKVLYWTGMWWLWRLLEDSFLFKKFEMIWALWLGALPEVVQLVKGSKMCQENIPHIAEPPPAAWTNNELVLWCGLLLLWPNYLNIRCDVWSELSTLAVTSGYLCFCCHHIILHHSHHSPPTIHKSFLPRELMLTGYFPPFQTYLQTLGMHVHEISSFMKGRDQHIWHQQLPCFS